ncbi:uncharacterized protein LOC132390819 isoform X2 [Hypanus sabinus]|uniref:uncharacterized protein LOC132390819 isoform X2 n=1 Tax=Hypanus sabinus TaxID=79690 RepID=UPI0028C3B32D|nr:uncharacterized protein LOC132390819 isoform X2 [Hypanus sabinus]
MAYLAVTFKLLIVGILALADNETTSTYQTNTESSTSLLGTEDTSNISSTTEENPFQTTNSSFVTTDIYSNVSTIQMDSSNVSVNQDNQSISDNTPSFNTTAEMTFTKPEVLKSQTPVTQKSSAAPTMSPSISEVSSSTVGPSQQTEQTSPTAIAAFSSFEPAMLIILVIIILIFTLVCLLSYLLYRKKRRYSFDLSQKTAEDANIPLSCPILPGGFELTADKENNKEVEKVNEDKTNHKKDSAPILNVPEEINGKQSNHEPEVNQPPAIKAVTASIKA